MLKKKSLSGRALYLTPSQPYAIRMDSRRQLDELNSPRGALVRWLQIGADRIAIEGLDAELAASLGDRWGAFLAESPDDARGVRYRMSVHRWEGPRWLEPRGVETYRVESLGGSGTRIAVSYNFAFCVEGPRRWKAVVREADDEPLGRVLDNVARQAVARVALDRGGFAMHGAGLLRDGRAWVFAGPSNAGKTTAIRLSEPARSLGDDLAIVLPSETGWCVPALPFDNTERITSTPGPGPYPLAAVLRLQQAEQHGVERDSVGRAIAALMGCAAFPWTMPEASADLLENVTALASEGRFARLNFRKDPDFWGLLDGNF